MTAFFYQQHISRLHVVMKKIYNFPKKSELPTFILLLKISWLIFSVVSGVEMKNLQRSEKAHFLVSWFCHSILCLQLRSVPLCFNSHLRSNVSLLTGYNSGRFMFILSFNIDITRYKFTIQLKIVQHSHTFLCIFNIQTDMLLAWASCVLTKKTL